MSWITTYSGLRFDPLSPRPEAVSGLDIAHALSNLCRFNGHCLSFYSVAQHSVLVAGLLEGEEARIGLLHDATEVYVADVPRPIKPHLANYDAIEESVWKAVAARFALSVAMPPSVRHADLRLLATERRDLMIDDGREWPMLAGIDPLPETIEPWSPAEAKRRFIEAFERLFGVAVDSQSEPQTVLPSYQPSA